MIWICGIEIGFLFLLVINELEFQAGVSIGIFALVVQFLAKVDIISYVRSHGMTLLCWALAYLALGVIWGLAKWYFFVRGKREKYLEIENIHQKALNRLPKEAMDTVRRIQEDFKNDVKRQVGNIPPQANDHKARIIGWIAYFPISLFWTICRDFLTSLFKRIYESLAGVFQRISNNQFKGVSHD